MGHVAEDVASIADNLVVSLSLDMGNESYAAYRSSALGYPRYRDIQASRSSSGFYHVRKRCAHCRETTHVETLLGRETVLVAFYLIESSERVLRQREREL